MYLPVTVTTWLVLPVPAPVGLDPASLVQVALVPDPGAEPADLDYHAGAWIDGRPALQVGPNATPYAEGFYMAWCRWPAAGGPGWTVRPGCRVRVGDPRV